MGAPKIFNLALKVNDKEAKVTLNSVGKDLKALRGYTRNLEEGTEQWHKANKKLAEVETVYDGMKKKQRDFINETKKAADATGDNKRAIQDFGASFTQVTSGLMSGDLVQVQAGLAGMRAGIVGATKASLAFIATPLGMVLAGLAVAIAAVTQYFRDSEEGQDAWNKITAITGTIVGNLTDLLSDLGGMLVRIFTEPQQTWDGFVSGLEAGYKFIKGQVYDRLIAETNILVGEFETKVLKMRIAWNDFTGDADEANKLRAELDEVNRKVEESTGLINDKNNELKGLAEGVRDAARNMGAEMANEAARAAKLADMAANADKIERQLIIERGEIEAQVAERRLKSREEDKYSAAERKKFLQEAVELERGLINKEIEAAAIRRNIKTEQNSFSKSNKEDLNEEARLTAAVSALERKRADAARTLQRDLLRVDGQIRKAGSSGGGSADPAIAEEKKRLDAIDKLEAEYAKKAEDREADTALKKAELDQKRAIEKAKSLGAEQALIDQIAAEHQIKVDEAKAAEEEKELERLRAFEDKKRELENEIELARAETEAEKEEIRREQEEEKAQADYEKKLAQFEEEMEFLQLTEEEKNSVIESLKEAHENTVLGIQKKYTDKKIQDEERLLAAKKKLISDSLDAAIDAAGQESKIGQALLIIKQILAAKETAIQLGLFTNKMLLNQGEAAGAAATGAAETAKVGFPQNIPLLIGFGIQIAGILKAVQAAGKSKAGVKTSFARGGFTDLFGMGYKDHTGHEVAGDVHVGEYVVPKVVREDPEVPPILDYLEKKRKKKLGVYADGGDTIATTAPATNPSESSSGSREIALLEAILEALGISREIYFGMEAEQKRQEAEKKLKVIQDRAKIKK